MHPSRFIDDLDMKEAGLGGVACGVLEIRNSSFSSSVSFITHDGPWGCRVSRVSVLLTGRPCHTGGALVTQGAPLSYKGRPCPAETAAGVFSLSCGAVVSCWRGSPRVWSVVHMEPLHMEPPTCCGAAICVKSVVHMEPPTFGHAAGVGSVRSDTSQGRVHHSVMHIQPDTRQVSQQAWPRGEALIPRAWTREEGPAGP